MQEFGTKLETFAKIRAKASRHAANNPLALFRTVVTERVRRGRIEVKLTRALKPSAGGAAFFDEASVTRAIAALSHLKEKHGVPGVIDLRALMLFPGLHDTFATMCAPDEPELELGLDALRAAMAEAESMRVQEGAELGAAIARELDAIQEGCGRIADGSAGHGAAVLARLRERLAELAKDLTIDERRLAEETALYVDRMDISEELARLGSHVTQMRGFMQLDEPVGKRMDFLIQELVREVNTIGSKSRDATIAHEVVNIKAALERAREQIQNVE